MSFAHFGMLLTTSEDSTTVKLLTKDLVHPRHGVLQIWRRAMFFGWPAAFGSVRGLPSPVAVLVLWRANGRDGDGPRRAPTRRC